MRNPTQLHFRFALAVVGLSIGFITTMIADLNLRPIQQPSSEIVLRLHVVPPGQAI